MDKLHLTELIDVGMLQQIQDAFSNMAGVAALTTDSKGIAVTQGSNFTDFCTLYTRMSPLGKKRCEECDRKGAEIAIERGSACMYKCHAGLVDFAAPIMANGKMVGSFIGGQVLVEPPDLDEIAETAKELGIDPVMSIAVAVFILINAIKNLKEVLDLFLEKAPHGISVEEIKEHVSEIEGVLDVHHIHIWSMDGHNNYATMHVVTEENPHSIKHKIRDELKEHGISHATLELEGKDEGCHEEHCHVEYDASAGHHHHHH